MHKAFPEMLAWTLNCAMVLLFAFTCRESIGQGCDLLLRDGVFNSFSQTSGNYNNSQWHQAWCSGTLKQTSSSGSTGVSLDVVVAQIPLGLNFNDAQQFQTMYQSKFCGSVDRLQVDFKNEAAFQKTADPSLMNAYVQCRQVENRGIETQFNESPNHRVFTVTMRYTKPFENGGKPRLKSVDFKPALSVKCTGTITPPMIIDANSNSMQCERLKETELSVLINTDAGAFTRDLPPVTPPPSDQERVLGALPQGTILAWAAKKPIPSGWHLCDGQLGTPELTDRYPFGTADPETVGVKMGLPSHHHSGTGTATSNISKSGWTNGQQYQNDGGQTTNHQHPVTITTDEQPNYPPGTKVQFIMKL